MNAEEKAKQQRFIVQNLGGIETQIKALVTTKDAFRAKVNDLTMNGSKDWSPEYVEKELVRVKADIQAKMVTANTDMVKRLEELRGLLRDRDSVLDLSPALGAALSLIQTIGAGLTYDQATMIQANFIHDQSGLRALRDAYKAQGVVSPGAIDGLIYNADSVIDNLKVLAYQGLVQDGSINTFATALSKLAALEGLTVESTPDQAGVMAAVRKAAGLSANPVGMK
jgi:hypothetical protein